MGQLKIRVELSELRKQRDQQKGLARIWTEAEGFEFPEKRWDDFIFITLSGWSSVIVNMLNNNDDMCILRYVDGNYAMKFEKSSGSNYSVSFGKWDMFDEIFESENSFTMQLNIDDFVLELIKINDEVVNVIKSEEISSEYIQDFIDWSNKLKDNKQGF